MWSRERQEVLLAGAAGSCAVSCSQQVDQHQQGSSSGALRSDDSNAAQACHPQQSTGKAAPAGGRRAGLPGGRQDLLMKCAPNIMC